MLRALVAGILAFLALVQLQVLRWVPSPPRGLVFLAPKGGSERVLFGLVLVLPFAVLPLLIQSFVAGLSSHPTCSTLTITDYRREILFPYLPYLLYIYALWIGLAFPVLLVLVRWIRRDSRQRVELIHQLYERLPPDQPQDRDLTAEAFESLVVAYQSYVVWLKEVAERYLFVVVVVALGLLYEQLTPSGATATPAALDVAKLALWLLLGPALVCFVILVAFGYQRTSKRLQHAFGVLAANLAGRKDPPGLFDRVVTARNSLIWEHGSTEFVVSVVKSAGIAMPLAIALGGYMLDALSHGNWLSIFLPESIAKAIKSVYGG